LLVAVADSIQKKVALAAVQLVRMLDLLVAVDQTLRAVVHKVQVVQAVVVVKVLPELHYKAAQAKAAQVVVVAVVEATMEAVVVETI
jgi:hypothetical protein